jgi:hypothetical protein
VDTQIVSLFSHSPDCSLRTFESSLPITASQNIFRAAEGDDTPVHLADPSDVAIAMGSRLPTSVRCRGIAPNSAAFSQRSLQHGTVETQRAALAEPHLWLHGARTGRGQTTCSVWRMPCVAWLMRASFRTGKLGIRASLRSWRLA